MDKVSIITRCYNKLEYTIRCIETIAKNTNYDNYEHIIINNNSNDGTAEWLNWIEKNPMKFWSKVKVYNMDKNYGDWGGMLKGLEYISEDSKYVVQVDNDIEMFDPEWIQKMQLALKQPGVNIIQLKRKGMKNYLVPRNPKDIEYKNETLSYGNSPAGRPVAFFMLETEKFIKVKDKLPIDLGMGKTALSKYLGGTFKFSNVECDMIDGYSKDINTSRFALKYPRGKTHTRNNIR